MTKFTTPFFCVLEKPPVVLTKLSGESFRVDWGDIGTSDLGPQQSLDGRAHQLSQCIGDTVSALQVGWLVLRDVDGVR